MGGLTRRRLLAAGGATMVAAACQQPAATSSATPAANAAAATSTTAATRAGPLNVRDFGARGDGATDDAAAFDTAIKAAIAKGPGTTLSVPAGRYLLGKATSRNGPTTITKAAGGIDPATQGGYPIKTHALVQSANGLTIAGEPGAIVVARDATAAAIWLDRCVDTTVKQLAFDYDPVPFTQGTITAVNAGAQTLDFKLDTGYQAPNEGFLGTVWATGAGDGFGLAYTSSGDLKFTVGRGDAALFLTNVTPVSAGVFRGKCKHALGDLAPGDRFVLPVRPPGAGTCFTVKLSRNCRLEAVTLHSSPVVAFRPEDCDALTLSGCVIAPPAGSERLLSTNADGVHCKSNRKGPLVDGCKFSRQGDDALTIVQTAHELYGLAGPTELIINTGLYQLFAPGDRIAIVSQATGLTKGEATVQDAMLVRYKDRIARKITVDKALTGLVSVDSLGLASVPSRADEDAAAPEKRPDLVGDLDMVGAGFVVRNGIFANHYANGIRIYSADGLVESNRFEGPAHSGTQIGMELGFREIFNARNVTIRGNTYVGSNGPTVYVRSLLGSHDAAKQGILNQGITIEDNKVQGYSGRVLPVQGAITVSNAQGVKVQRNAIGPLAAGSPAAAKAVVLDLCKDVTVQDNDIAWTGRSGDPLSITAQADRPSVTVRNNRIAS